MARGQLQGGWATASEGVPLGGQGVGGKMESDAGGMHAQLLQHPTPSSPSHPRMGSLLVAVQFRQFMQEPGSLLTVLGTAAPQTALL